jgi:hypothetical protein
MSGSSHQNGNLNDSNYNNGTVMLGSICQNENIDDIGL